MLGLRPRQCDAITERVKEAVFRDLALSFDGQPMQGRDLLGRSADPSNSTRGSIRRGSRAGRRGPVLAPAPCRAFAPTIESVRVQFLDAN
jgi:hypothetical protein